MYIYIYVYRYKYIPTYIYINIFVCIQGGYFFRAKTEKKNGIEVVDVCIGTLGVPVDKREDEGNKKKDSDEIDVV
jgi:hypothetical protein